VHVRGRAAGERGACRPAASLGGGGGRRGAGHRGEGQGIGEGGGSQRHQAARGGWGACVGVGGGPARHPRPPRQAPLTSSLLLLPLLPPARRAARPKPRTTSASGSPSARGLVAPAPQVGIVVVVLEAARTPSAPSAVHARWACIWWGTLLRPGTAPPPTPAPLPGPPLWLAGYRNGMFCHYDGASSNFKVRQVLVAVCPASCRPPI
jgi:hypothetical protein